MRRPEELPQGQSQPRFDNIAISMSGRFGNLASASSFTCSLLRAASASRTPKIARAACRQDRTTSLWRRILAYIAAPTDFWSDGAMAVLRP
jgi:hypothetical protein